jgi:molecular chaperone GrpE (heat shock protein)
VWKWLGRLLGKKPADEQALALEQEAQKLRLELAEQEQTVARLKQELERQRGGASAHVTEAVQTQVEQLLTDVSTPVSQLLTQAHLLEVEGQPVQARDVLALVKRLVRTLEDRGLTLVGRVGESVPFDPDHHEPLSADVSPKSGQMVTVRFVGVAHRGKLLRKAGVEQSSNEQ